MPDYPSYRFRDNDTGESFEMPWSGPSEPTDRDIDMYRYQQRQREANSWGNRIKSYIPDPLENAWSGASSGVQNAWTELNKPRSNAPSEFINRMTPEGGGFAGYNALNKFAGSILDDQTSYLNMGLNALSLGGWGAARSLGTSALARLAAMGQTGAGAATAAAGGINLLGSEDAGDVGSALLQIGLGGVGTKFGLNDVRRLNAPKPGPITDPTRLLPESTGGPRFEAGPGGVRDFTNPSPDLTPPFVHTPELMDLDMPTPAATNVTPDLQMRTVNPRGPSNLQPFEQDASIFHQMRQEPVLGPLPDPSIGPRPQVPQVEQVGPSPFPRPQRTVFGAPIESGIPDVAPPRPSGRPMETPEVTAARAEAREASKPFAYDLETWKAEQIEMGSTADEVDEAIRQSTEVGVDPTKSDDLYDLENYMGAGADDPDWIPEQVALGHWDNPELKGWHSRTYQPDPADLAAVEANIAGDIAPPVPEPVAPARDALARVAAVANQAADATPAPLVRPAVPKGPTPDRVLRLGRGAHDPVRTVFPDKLHADLYSAMGRLRKQTRGQKGIAPDFEGLARQMGVSVKDVSRIASEYRNRVNAMAKELPATIEGGVGQMEAPHWSGKLPEMVQPTPAPPPIQAAAPPATPPVAPKGRAARQAAWEAEKAQRAAEIAAEAPATELNAALEARGAAPVAPEAAPAQPTLPKGKKARVTAVMDELVASGTNNMVDIANDPAKLLSTAKKAGIKSGTLKAAIAEFIKNEEGYLQLPTKQQLKDFGGKAFDAANQLRMTSMLSGLALPKSFAGNIGAHVAAALEDRSIEPLKVLLNYKQIGKDVADGWKSLANPAAVQGIGKLNLPGRAMGALDFASIKSLQRAGLSEKEAKELLLTGSNAFSAMKGMDSPLAKLFIPFRTTPINQVMQGFTRVHKHPEIWIGAMAAGAAAGSKVEDKEKLALMSAFAGPYALPFLAGAAYATQDFETFGSISPIPEWGLSKTLANPFSAFTQSPGRRWTRSNLGFGKLAEIEKRVERGQRVGSKRGGSRASRPSR